MKKSFLSLLVIVLFIGYSFYERATQKGITPVVPPKTTMGQGVTDTPSSTASHTSQPSTPSTPTPSVVSGYKDGTYTGDPADAFYGMIQVQATITGGKITTIQFLQAPNDRGTSIAINSQADPLLAQEAIQAQSAQVDAVSGASDTSQAFVQSLQSALDKAKG